jgi:hypothetical protein
MHATTDNVYYVKFISSMMQVLVTTDDRAVPPLTLARVTPRYFDKHDNRL